MSNLVIVALPAKDDDVWKVSSEQVPHLTLLFLGDTNVDPTDDDDAAEDVQRIVDFVSHAVEVSEHGPFMLDVDYRDKLGPDDADVVFFKKGWSFKWIEHFRNQLLQQDDIRSAYDSVEQYPEWVPHLTLGYPAAPAKDDAIEHPLRWIDFDRIAVWTDDFSGPEFRLQWPERDSERGLAVAYSAAGKSAIDKILNHDSVLDDQTAREEIQAKVKDILDDVSGDPDGDGVPDDEEIVAKLMDLIDDFSGDMDRDLAQSAVDEALAHHGVKGMKWGERKEATTKGKSNTEGTKVAMFGQFALLSPKFREHITGDTKAKVGVFGMYALLDSKVRNDLKQASEKVAVGKADKEWERGLKDGSAYVAVNNKAADHFNAHIDELNKKYPTDRDWSKEDYYNPQNSKDPQFKSYMKDISKLTQDSIAHAGNELQLKNPSGTKQVEVTNPSGVPGDYHLTVKEVAHASETPSLDIQVKFKTDAKGRVTGFELPDGGSDSIAQSALLMSKLGEQFVLEHYGVLGMKWGVRRAKGDLSVGGKVSRLRKEGDALHNQAKIAHPSKASELRAKGDEKHKQADALEKKAKAYLKGPDAVTPHATSRVPFGDKKKTKIETEGGQNHPAHEDALKVARAQEKLKKSGLHALSNQDLRDVANRIQLETQVKQLTGHKGKQFVQRHLRGQGEDLTRQAGKSAIRKGIKTAGVAALL